MDPWFVITVSTGLWLVTKILQLRNIHSVPKNGERVIFVSPAAASDLAIIEHSYWLGPDPAIPEHIFVHGRSIIEIACATLPLAGLASDLPGNGKVVTTMSGKPCTGMRVVEPKVAADTSQQFNNPTNINQAGINAHIGYLQARMYAAIVENAEKKIQQMSLQTGPALYVAVSERATRGPCADTCCRARSCLPTGA